MIRAAPLVLCLVASVLITARVNHVGVDLLTNDYQVQLSKQPRQCEWLAIDTGDAEKDGELEDGAHKAVTYGYRVVATVNLEECKVLTIVEASKWNTI